MGKPTKRHSKSSGAPPQRRPSKAEELWYRWEFLRRNPEFHEDIKRCVAAYGEADGYVGPPSDYEKFRLFDDTCSRWGLEILPLPSTTFSRERIADAPLFSDFPRLQLTERDPEKLREMVRRMASQFHIDVSDRTLRRYFTKKPVPGPRGFTLRGLKRKHWTKLGRYLAVWDFQHPPEGGDPVPLAKFARTFHLPLKEALRRYEVARQLIGLPPAVTAPVLSAAVQTGKGLEDHFPCPHCHRLGKPCLVLEAQLPQDKWPRESLSRDIEGRAVAQWGKARGKRVRPKRPTASEEHDLQAAAWEAGLRRADRELRRAARPKPL